ncbi:MAG: aminotransferase class V-fold PLP-dependent enzyme, partial [Acidimicrobiales bacterium]
MVEGPFGPRPVVYADYTASGRSLSFLEDYISSVVLPLYANTHTESSGTGLQTSRFREDAREIIASCVGAGDEHAVLFCGSGTTGAVAKLVGVLGLRIPSTLDDRFHLSDNIAADERPVVFIGPYEHHSNELPWRESIADVVTIDEDAEGHVDLAQLASELERYQDRPYLIGSFSAASNVTGIVTDTVAVSSLLHRYGALAFWDYAAAAPYLTIDMGSVDQGPGYLDAIFISPHKLIGGPGTPGVLVARRELFTNRVPDVPGGGTVSFVNPLEHDYLPEIEHREEGGTPDIIGSIRAGLVFQLKMAVGVDEIRAREEDFVQRAVDAWDKHPNVEILGSRAADRLSIVSFVVRDGDSHPAGGPSTARFLHHNFVVAVLNDLFGIQSRGGCSCAGPYGHRLLGIDLDQSHEFEREITRGCEGIKPGWVRVNFNYFIAEDIFQYIVDAVGLVADAGGSLLPYYRFEPHSGLWRHRNGLAAPPLSLHDISYVGREMT